MPCLKEGTKLFQFHGSFEDVGKAEGVGESLLARRAVLVVLEVGSEGGRREDRGRERGWEGGSEGGEEEESRIQVCSVHH